MDERRRIFREAMLMKGQVNKVNISTVYDYKLMANKKYHFKFDP